MIVVITLMFAFCNICPFILNIWEALDPTLFYGPYQIRAYVALDLSNTFVLFNSSITFVLYIIYCRKYRVLFRYFVRFLCCCRDPSSAGYDLASDPSFRRYSVVTNSEGGLEATVTAYALFTKRWQNRQFSSLDGDAFGPTDVLMRRGFRDRRFSAFQPPEFRSRVFTQ